MGKKVYIAPSLLAADFSNLRYEIQRCVDSGCDYLHYDVMDGHFVNNISLGIPVLEKTSKVHGMINDVHLMITDPSLYVEAFAKAGADIITFHYETCKKAADVFYLIDKIHRYGCKAGISIKPMTPVSKVFPFLNSLDMVLIMTVDPGFGGQEFNDDCLPKILSLSEYLQSTQNKKVLIEVDGGINNVTAKKCREYGADILVSGSYLFGSDEIYERVNLLKE